MKIKSIMIKGVGHRHVVLTTPRKLGGYFLKDRHLLNVMANAGAELIKDILSFYRKEGAKNKVKKLTVLGFIHLLVQHIPEENQKMIHYYGLYARHQAKKLKRIVEDLIRCFNQEGWEAEQEKLPPWWRNSFLSVPIVELL